MSGMVHSSAHNHCNTGDSHLFNSDSSLDVSRNFREYSYNYDNFIKPEAEPSMKRRRCSASGWESSGRHSQAPNACKDVPSKQPSSCYNVPLRNSRAYDDAYSTCNNNSTLTTSSSKPRCDASAPTRSKRDHSWLEDTETDNIFMSKEEIERCSPSRKDGIDAMHEAHLRYSYCAFLQNLGIRLDLPQTTIGTAMVLCHRFFVRRSHACHDRFLIATAALFLAAKSEETARPLNNVLKASCEIFHKQDLAVLSYFLPVDWFEQYRERITEAEQMILTTLNFELNVQHPYESLTSTLEKLGLSETVLVNLALHLVSEGVYRRISLLTCLGTGEYSYQSHAESSFSSSAGVLCTCALHRHAYSRTGYWKDNSSPNWQKILGFFQLGCCIRSWLRSSLWLQFKPYQIAAGAAYLASKFLNMDFSSHHSVWKEFQTPPVVLRDVAQQLMELF
ncbi:putative membrane-associated kinase regulator 1-like [Capsicum annuum]|nr:putative membrane-associated kinase regulator 1-like [Capsicum annuum]